MKRWLALIWVVAALTAGVAGAAGDSFIKGSLYGAFLLPQMELPRADAWAKGIDDPEEKANHDGELGDMGLGMGFGVGFGVTFGGYFRWDATIANLRTERAATYTGDQYSRDVKLTTHVIPVRLGGTFLAPALFSGRLTPEMGLGFVAFISEYDTDQEINAWGSTTRGTAWTREVCYGPEVKVGAEFALFGPLTVEGYVSYWTAEATLNNWAQYGEASLRGPAREDFTGWAIWIAPRVYI